MIRLLAPNGVKCTATEEDAVDMVAICGFKPLQCMPMPEHSQEECVDHLTQVGVRSFFSREEEADGE